MSAVLLPKAQRGFSEKLDLLLNAGSPNIFTVPQENDSYLHELSESLSQYCEDALSLVAMYSLCHRSTEG